MNRRTLFKKLFATAVVVALAPRLAFKDAPELPVFSDIDTEYRCVMNRVTIHSYSLHSVTWHVEMPSGDSYLIENFNE